MKIKGYLHNGKLVLISKEYTEKLLEDISKIKLSYHIKCFTNVKGYVVTIKGPKIDLFDLLTYLLRHYIITLE